MSWTEYWGKAQPDGEAASYHPLAFHCLDVAAVGLELLAVHDDWRNWFQSSAQVSEQSLCQILAYTLAVHDLGKFSESFQHLQPDLHFELQGVSTARPYDVRHDSLGARLWIERYGANFGDTGSLIEICVEASTGHHGVPPIIELGRLGRFFSQDNLRAADEFEQRSRRLFPIEISAIDAPPIALIRRYSWWFAGLAVLADWIGSDQRQFPYTVSDMSLDAYWHTCAQPRAQEAVRAASLGARVAKTSQTLRALFPFIEEPTPLQQAVGSLELPATPQLVVIEDVTGAGKTEAALHLAQRMVAAGKGNGFYVALPTMATANAMYSRIAGMYQQFFSSPASLVLAHGAAHLVGDFERSVDRVTTIDAEYAHAEPTATAHCASWLADHRKAALLSPAGVGTIDQALMAILMTRHQSLRLLGLREKVLIVDEVHACDDYMNRLLRTLLNFHSAAGGSAILLSATLPRAARESLISAFNEDARIADTRYPLITSVMAQGKEEIHTATRPALQRDVRFELVSDLETIRAAIEKARGAGQCVAWIRNTVADALDATRWFPDAQVFHSRFALGDRLDIEQSVLSKFGKASHAEDRRGQLLIATQVIEQSLDVDFDVLITDLAPIDLLIQRAGRCCRHPRAENGDPAAADARGPPHVLVYGPQPVHDPDENWYRAVFPRGSWVYPNHAQLWLAAQIVCTQNTLQVPASMRDWIEEVYTGTAPAALDKGRLRVANANARARGQAVANAVQLDRGYRATPEQWWDETNPPTRLGEPTSTLVLFRGRTSWCETEALSSVRVRRSIVSAAESQANLKQSHRVAVSLTENAGRWRGQGTGDRGAVTLWYSRERGLEIES